MEHFLAYRVLLDQWDREEAANGGMPLRLKSFENTASIPFPKALPQYVDSVWGTLTLERDRLMQVTRSRSKTRRAYTLEARPGRARPLAIP